MQKDYHHCLDELAGAVPKRKAALIRSLLPGIEAALNSGQSLKDIWEALGNEGLQMSYHGFHKAVWRAERKRKPTAASGWGKQDKPSEAQGLRETKVDTVAERDPFANLRRLEIGDSCGIDAWNLSLRKRRDRSAVVTFIPFSP